MTLANVRTFRDKMNDIFNNKLEVGDTVAFNPPVYKGLVKGEILKFTPKGVTVSYKPTGKQNTTSCNVSPSSVAKCMACNSGLNTTELEDHPAYGC